MNHFPILIINENKNEKNIYIYRNFLKLTYALEMDFNFIF